MARDECDCGVVEVTNFRAKYGVEPLGQSGGNQSLC